jgi:hypothetical protein
MRKDKEYTSGFSFKKELNGWPEIIRQLITKRYKVSLAGNFCN